MRCGERTCCTSAGGIHEGRPAFRSLYRWFQINSRGILSGAENIETIGKQSLNVELVNVKDQVNRGLNLITFFVTQVPAPLTLISA